MSPAEAHFQDALLDEWSETWNGDERARFAAMSLRSDLSPAQLLDKLSGMAVCNFAIDRLVKAIDDELAVTSRLRDLLDEADELLDPNAPGISAEDEGKIRDLRARIAALIGAP